MTTYAGVGTPLTVIRRTHRSALL